MRSRRKDATIQRTEIGITFRHIFISLIRLNGTACIGSFVDKVITVDRRLIDILRFKVNSGRISTCLVEIAVRVIVLSDRCHIEDSGNFLQSSHDKILRRLSDLLELFDTILYVRCSLVDFGNGCSIIQRLGKFRSFLVKFIGLLRLFPYRATFPLRRFCDFRSVLLGLRIQSLILGINQLRQLSQRIV